MTPGKHTPAPWFPTTDSRFNDIARIGRAWIIGTLLPLSEFGDIDADATLIAEAPELLAALRDFDDAFSTFNPNDSESRARMRRVVIRARAAIAKAAP